MMFKDREEAGRKLADALVRYKDAKNAVAVALPRGGVVLGRVVADALNIPLDLIVPRKIGAQYNEEYAIGAITETGEAVWNEAEKAQAEPDYLAEVMRKERKEAERRLDVYRAGLPARDLKDKTVIIVDDGVATGLTMLAAIKTARTGHPRKVVAAVPVCPPDSLKRLKAAADETVVLDSPAFFFAVGGSYDAFPQVSDDQVIALMKNR